MQKDYYAILGVTQKASQKAIEEAFQKLARQCHPDLYPGDLEKEKRFKELAEAYAVLGDPEKRKAYHAGKIDPAWQEDTPYVTWRELVKIIGKPYKKATITLPPNASLETILESIRGKPAEKERRSSKGLPLRETAETDFLTAVRGGTISVAIRYQEGCLECQGLGNLGGNPCPYCGGGGVRIKSERVHVKIPPGTLPGDILRVRGKGLPGWIGGPRGDLLLHMEVKPHPYFERKGYDIYGNLPLTVYEAFAGCQLEVPTIHGHVKVKVPPKSQNQQLIRLKGKGIWNPRTRTYGDHYCRVQVMIPDRLTELGKSLAKRLEEFYSLDIRSGLLEL